MSCTVFAHLHSYSLYTFSLLRSWDVNMLYIFTVTWITVCIWKGRTTAAFLTCSLFTQPWLISKCFLVLRTEKPVVLKTPLSCKPKGSCCCQYMFIRTTLFYGMVSWTHSSCLKSWWQRLAAHCVYSQHLIVFGFNPTHYRCCRWKINWSIIFWSRFF